MRLFTSQKNKKNNINIPNVFSDYIWSILVSKVEQYYCAKLVQNTAIIHFLPYCTWFQLVCLEPM